MVESDYPDVRYAEEQTWAMIETVAEVRQWAVETSWGEDADDPSAWGVVRRLEANWQTFLCGNHTSEKRGQKRARKLDFTYQEWGSEEE